MIFLIILFGILLATGLFFIIADILKLPSIKIQKAMLNATKQNNEKTKNIDVLINGWAVKIAKYILLDEYKKIRMKKTLNAAGINKTPEEYIAVAMVKSGLIVLFIIPSLLILPLLSPILLCLAIMI